MRKVPASGEAQSYHEARISKRCDWRPEQESYAHAAVVASGVKGLHGRVGKTFLAADIPLHKLRNPHVIQMFKNLGQKTPSETVCRDYVKTLANNEQDRLKYLLKDKSIFIVIDGSEVDKTKFINVIVGDIDVPEKTYLIECCVTETVNQSIICMKIDNILRKLDIARENFLLFLLDAVSYVTACAATLKVLYPRLFHVTCLAHMLHAAQLCGKSARCFHWCQQPRCPC